ncbi:hypothetical protein Back11_17930 [Paenibacillus baekrokdamisoli]|uniref:Uncharacterized protein n=1 Tax=Paenibacillus baekrokdamisoli TaxID=1712516 RepID=A0A3G9J9A7_9BACL|nr:DUF2971 domain-containing protein [Paenibacillus baekrokdamisoli]MBB3073511.1 hypothetical protein [Paenibacillus baekrokdamisoli]BBH20448.1 hypothetical protein Back11_17930 [Paenibacillus baekrokdamisoli]
MRVREYKNVIRNQRNENKQNKQYHYSSLDAIMSIFKHKELWLTKSEYLNDISEIKYARRIAKKVRDQAKINYQDDDLLMKLLEDCNDEIFDKGIDSYILSMSMNADSLPLWSNCSNQDGYCIGFDRSFISVLDRLTDSAFQNIHGFVIYDPIEQEKILSEEISIAFDIWKEHGDGKPGNELNYLWNHIIRTFYIYSLFFKDPSFRSEEEYRVVVLMNKKRQYGGHFINSNEVSSDHIHFRSKNGAIVPYIKLPITHDDEKIPLKSISIGPRNNLNISAEGLRYYLNYNKYENCEINKSIIPLRY